jgi:hypothetical protein
MRVFNLSLHRCGTRSFHKFCTDNELHAQHWPGYEFDKRCEAAALSYDLDALWGMYAPLVKEHDVCCDIPCPILFREAYTAYPDAKFLLILRRSSEWTKSIRRHMDRRPFDFLERLMYWSICRRPADRIDHYTDAELESGYLHHIREVVNLLHARHADFRLFQLDDQFIGVRLATFLGVSKCSEFGWVE